MHFEVKDWLQPVVALLVGALAGLIAAMSAIIGKENKISEFRQAWIDAQRNDLAAINAEAIAFIGEADVANKATRLAEFDVAQARVELRENPDLEEWTEVRGLIRELRATILAPPVDTSQVERLRVSILNASRGPLKANWTIVKKGEAWYQRFTKLIGVTVFAVIVFILTIVLEWAAFSPRPPAPAPATLSRLVSAPAKEAVVSARPAAETPPTATPLKQAGKSLTR